MTQKNQKSKDFESSFLISCPVCSKKAFSIVQKIDKIPYFGEVLMTFATCSDCKYKASDILPLEKRQAPEKQERKITSEKDLSLRLVKSKNATIKIPEIKLTIKPGPGSEAYVSNVEGLLIRIIHKVKGFRRIHPDKEKEYEKIIEKLEKMRNGKKKFTLILKDKTGQSAILTKELKNL